MVSPAVSLWALLTYWDDAERLYEWTQQNGDIADFDDRHHEVLHARQLVLEEVRRSRR